MERVRSTSRCRCGLVMPAVRMLFSQAIFSPEISEERICVQMICVQTISAQMISAETIYALLIFFSPELFWLTSFAPALCVKPPSFEILS